MPRTMLFAGGASGGHLYPGIAVARELIAAGHCDDVLFAGTRRAAEVEILQRDGFAHLPLPVLPWQGKRRAGAWAYSQLASLLAVRQHIRRTRPQAVIGLGSYACVPAVIAAKSFGVPVVLLEQNVLPGRACRRLSALADTICTSFAASAEHLPKARKIVVTGNPIRREIAALAGNQVAEHPTGQKLLVLGGSQGARSLNEFVPAALVSLSDRLSGWQVVHQTGANEAAVVRHRYRTTGVRAQVSEFLGDMPEAYRTSDLIISRSGATTLAELACAGLPAVLVPYPQSADDHQRRNAEPFVEAGAAVLCEEGERFAERLAEAVSQLLDPVRREAMSRGMRTFAQPDAATNVVAEILKVAR